jgi:Ca-activated chloride channel homolog
MLGMRYWVQAVACSAALWCGPDATAQLASADPGVAIVPRTRPQPVRDAEPLLRIDSSLVQIPVHVTNAIGMSIAGLTANNFRILEDRVEQTVTSFAMDDAPVSIGFLFDASGSMKAKMKQAAEAAAAFFRTTNREDEFFLVTFNDRARLIEPFTRDSNAVYEQIAHTRPNGRTTLIDAIYLAIGQMKKAKHMRKAIVILSDGGDNWSRRSAHELKNALQEADVQVYAMGIFDEEMRTSEEKNGPRLLDEIAEETGGRHYPVESLEQLPEISERIGRDLRNQYVLGYHPSNVERDGKYRQVVVKLATPDAKELRTYYRRGYYAPAD